MNFQSPTAKPNVPVSAKACTTPEQCVIFAFAATVRHRNKVLKASFKKSNHAKNRLVKSKSNELLTLREVEQAIAAIFPKETGIEGWIATTLESLVARGIVTNVNAEVPGMAPVFRCELDINSANNANHGSISALKSSETKAKVDASAARKQILLKRKVKKIKKVKNIVRKRK